MDQATSATGASAPDQLKLAFERTYLAYERTLMAWIRTATSLITFGFALYKFFFYMRMQEPALRDEQLLGPRVFGEIMIGIGVVALTIATVQYRQQIRRLRLHYPEAPSSLSLALSALIALLGILAFVAAIFRE
jgi:putative membrane protein